MNKAFNPSTVRIATFDLDGTVLCQGRLSNKVKDALLSLSKMGIATAVATGRDISQIPKNVLDCFQYRITNNGSHVSDDKGHIILDRPIPIDTSIETLRMLHKLKGHSCLYLNGKVVATPLFLLRILMRTEFASKSHRSTTKEARKGNSLVRLNLGRFLKSRNMCTYKIQTFFKNNADAMRAQNSLMSIGKVNPVLSRDICLETMDHGVSKANGLLQLCKTLGCSADNVISFGDSANDIEILKTSGFSVAMGNAEACVKAVADHITESVAEDGVATAIGRLFSV